jgi:hypothetical protein
MAKKIIIFLSTMKKSSRLKYATKRLKELKLKYKIFYGISGKNEREKKIIYSQYDREKVLSYLGREMGFNEIAGQWKIIKMFKYAIKKKYQNIIFFDDDFYPSRLFREWIDKKIYFKGNKIIQFQCMPTGFLQKKYLSVLNNKVKVYYAQTHLFNPGAAQVTIGFMKKFIKITNGKTIGLGDYPFNFFKNDIKLMLTIPFMGYPDDKGFSYLSEERKYTEKTLFKNFRKFLYKIIGIKFVNKIFNFFRIPYYVLFIPFLFRKYKNLDYYIEYYFEKYFYKLINPILNFYIDIENIYTLKSSYPKDLKKFAKYRVFDN